MVKLLGLSICFKLSASDVHLAMFLVNLPYIEPTTSEDVDVVARGTRTIVPVCDVDKAMRIDLLQHHIKVTAIHPGAAETEFSKVRFKGDEQKAELVYDGYKALQAIDVANIVYYTATLPEHVSINDLTVTCLAQANSYYLHK